MSDDTIRPPEPPTLDELPFPSNDTQEFGVLAFPEVIAAGSAESTLAAALDRLATAFVEVEATAMALARLVDLQANQGQS